MWQTIDIVPSSIRNDPQVIAACEAIDAELIAINEEFYQGSSKADPSICFWPDVDKQVPPLLDVLAWEMHVDVWAGWEGEMTVEEKQHLIAQSIDWHRHKGTKYAVDQMMRTVFKQGAVTEWYEYGGTPYHFRIVTEDEIVDPDSIQKVLEAVYAVKNVRSWLDSLIRSRMYKVQNLYHSIVTTQAITTTIRMME